MVVWKKIESKKCLIKSIIVNHDIFKDEIIIILK